MTIRQRVGIIKLLGAPVTVNYCGKMVTGTCIGVSTHSPSANYDFIMETEDANCWVKPSKLELYNGLPFTKTRGLWFYEDSEGGYIG